MIMFQKGLLVLSMVLASTSVFAGEGKNGEEPSGMSITLDQDRAYKIEELQAAVDTCSTQMARSVYRQVTKGKEPVLVEDTDHRSWNILTEEGISAQICLSAEPKAGYSGCYCGIFAQITNREAKFVVQNSTPTCKLLSNSANRSFELTYPKNYASERLWGKTISIPSLDFISEVNDVQYDEYGTAVNYQKIAKQVKITSTVVPGTVRLYNKSVPTGVEPKETNVTIDTAAYEQCLQSELQGAN